MITYKAITEERKQIAAMKMIVDVYGEVASIRMRNIRDSVLKNRSFLSEIQEIFQDCLAAYSQKVSFLVKRGKLKKGGKVTFLAHNGQTVYVFISANTGFYGAVVQNTFKKMLDDLRKTNAEVTIIGKLGKSLFLDAEPNRPFTYFELPDYGVDRKALSEAISHLVKYQQIKIYYGKYISVITQKPDSYELSAGAPIIENVIEPKEKYLFEPSVENILMFFETQIFASLFDQSLRESQLAKFASRILAMEEAGENIRKEVKALDIAMAKLRHTTSAKKQINNLPSIFLK